MNLLNIHRRSFRLFSRKLHPLALLAALAGSAGAQESGVRVVRQEPLPQGVRIVLSIAAPEVSTVTGPDGKAYARLALAGSGAENEFGRPALPFVRQVVEVPVGLQVSVRPEERQLQELKVPHPVWPHQKPVPKLPGAKDAAGFLVETSAYTGADADQFQKAAGGAVEVTPYRKRGRDFVDILARPFAYHAAQGVVRYPAELVLDLTYSAPDLPKSAGPRPGKVTVLDLALRDKADLEFLDREGFNFELRGRDRAEVFATEAEVRALKQAGLEFRAVGQQPAPPPPSARNLGEYHDYPALTAFLQDCTNSHPDLCRLTSIGRSVQNRELWAMKLTAQPDLELGKPRVRLAGTIHGDEPLGAEMCLYLIDLLANGRATNARLANLLATTEIWVLPLLNPDGRAAGTRFNASGFDLNRSFPDGGGGGLGNPLFGPPPAMLGRPPEVVHLMRLATNLRFTLAANLHGGALVVNYPYDDDELGAVNSPTPDDTLFRFVSLEYSSHNLPMYNSPTFAQGIVNGAVWYVVDGGLQDWSYRYAGCNEVTLEISNVKQPPAAQLPQYWNDNREAMLSYLETVHTGIQGWITDAGTAQPVHAAVKVLGLQHGVFSDPRNGDYHRMLRPGTYHLAFTAPNHATRVVSNVVVQAGQATQVDVTLEPLTRPPNRLLLVTSETLGSSLPALKARKQAEGFEVLDVVVPAGTRTNLIRGAIRDAWAVFPADYVLLVGDTPQLPPFPDTHPTDLPYAMMDAGETAANYLGKDVVLGRVSLTTPTAIGQFAQKLAAFASSLTNRTGDLTWVSHGNNGSEYGQAERGHNYCISNCVPPTYANTCYYQNVGSAAELTAHINFGTDGVIYSGHGGEFTWGRWDYDVGTLAGLNNLLHVPVVVGHCCVSGSFDETVCFGEAWLQTTARGVCYVGATDNTYWDEDEWMQMAEFDAMAWTTGLSIGKAIDEGLYRVHQMAPASARYYYTAYHVLGDPTAVMFDAVPLPLAIRTAPALPPANKNLPYTATLRAAGGAPPYAWSVVAGQLPAGLSLSAAGVLSGTPTETGASEFTVEVSDLSSPQQTATGTFTLAVWDLSAAFNQALDTTDWPWAPGGDSYWQLQFVTTHDGVDAARSGPLGDGQQNWIETQVQGPGILSFWWKVASEQNYDFLQFHLNGTLQSGRISGNVDWQSRSYLLGEGPQTLRWQYLKDSSVSSGEDCGWLDQVTFTTSLAPTFVEQPRATNAIAGDTVSFSVTVVGQSPLSYQWFFEGVPVPNATAATCVLTAVQTNQTGDYWVVVANAHSAATSEVARLTVVPGISLAEAIDQPTWLLTSGGNATWKGQVATAHDGLDAAQSGVINHSQETWLQTTVNGPGQIGFWWKVSSEANYDFLDFLTNGVTVGGRISGNVDWQFRSVRLGVGAQTLRWRYFKDGSVTVNADLACVDQVVWTPDSPLPVISQGPRDATVCVGERAVFSVLAGGPAPLAYQWFRGSALLPGATASSHSIAAATYADAGLYFVRVTNAAGATNSAPALLTVLPPGSVQTNTYTAPVAIAIPEVGAASPYPSILVVSNLPGVVRQVTVTLVRLTHTYPRDVNVLLAGPSGLPVMLMGRAGDGTDASNLVLVFDDLATAPLPATALTSGVFRPTDLSSGGVLPPPAPGRPYAGTLAGLEGINPNGPWRLYVADAASSDSGSLAGGWVLRVVTVQPDVPVILMDPRLEGHAIHFSFLTRVGRTYFVEYQDTLGEGEWMKLEEHSGDGSLHTCTDVTTGATRRFYRLRVE